MPNVTVVYLYNNNYFNEIINRDYDLIVDLQNNFRSNAISRKLKGKVYKFDKHRIQKFLLVKLKKNINKKLPPIPLRYIDSVPELNGSSPAPELNFSFEIFKEEKLVGLAPGSKHFTKQYPIEYFVELAQLLKSNGYKVALIGGKDDIEVSSQIKSKTAVDFEFFGKDDVECLASGISKCEVLICNDSGLMHLACAVKTPVIAIYGSTVPDFGFVPYGNKNLILENKLLSCRPCSHIGRSSCPEGHFKCMLEIKPEIVFDGFKKFVEE